MIEGADGAKIDAYKETLRTGPPSHAVCLERLMRIRELSESESRRLEAGVPSDSPAESRCLIA